VSLDLPLIWAGLIAVAVLAYVVLDGFDLGVGILFPFARGAAERDAMMNAIAPYWDGNETWLVLGGGGLLAAFPAAYAILLPAFYLPLILMLLALILRGVAFEFRLRGRKRGKVGWSFAFFAGSLVATLAQGVVLGGFIQGVVVRQGAFAGRALDVFSPYAGLVAVGLVFGYVLLGGAWLMIRTEEQLHAAARRWTAFAAGGVAALLLVVSLATLFVHPRVAERWGLVGHLFDFGRFLPLVPIPLTGILGLGLIVWGLRRGSHRMPFVGAVVVFLSGYAGLAAGFYPFAVPYVLTFRQAANADNALQLMLIGAGLLLPLIFAYTAFVYYVFRGKVAADAGYH
jgi:cytochrome d ubiquinol oxidase subunit II